MVVRRRAKRQTGRGLQIDRQSGETVVVSYFGYREDGTATFYQASGKVTDGKNFVADLLEYQNGRAIGGRSRDGELARNVGKVRLTFNTESSGTITLPGEKQQNVSRYVFDDTRARLRNRFQAVMFESSYGITDTLKGLMNVKVIDDDFSAVFQYDGSKEYCVFSGKLVATGNTFQVTKGNRVCTGDGGSTPTPYSFTDLSVNEAGVLSARGSYGDVLSGVCVRRTKDLVATPSWDQTNRCTAEDLGLSSAPAN
ncbi:hypothetical protein [Diaphorobacter aerolatus]|uniref:Uncharacterized protein n=1 Tax=Diaphorobacter aerolatus TaxID=1288495 RepID=A0A7H0GFR3_9BURK|nr:hypothetical protein [Diaphorobacter aerolatus]QNP47129.1 hypothetical protein H9K75_11895 [Diaphorobacter aerolatus]